MPKIQITTCEYEELLKAKENLQLQLNINRKSEDIIQNLLNEIEELQHSASVIIETRMTSEYDKYRMNSVFYNTSIKADKKMLKDLLIKEFEELNSICDDYMSQIDNLKIIDGANVSLRQELRTCKEKLKRKDDEIESLKTDDRLVRISKLLENGYGFWNKQHMLDNIISILGERKA